MVSYASPMGMGVKLTANPGDRIATEPQTIEEKAKQVAVDTIDITGDHIKVPTYFVVKYPDGDTKALHHVKDAEAISDLIRQMQLQQEEWPQESEEVKHWLNLPGILVILAGFLMTSIVLVGIF
ncbi:MAG: hypothetical protein F6K49_04240 [Moorea sp. SIO3I6]|nr:hypothetical protein [Moorena sp. SIO3I8]NEO24293.1 hypothetical protein [Moorena sp. SIO4A5]NEP21268.1 hypothetical protein [Moorena sp. SIO3I6]NEQ57497.1 hypothetical protein [Moorena sp. SIO4A1]